MSRKKEELRVTFSNSTSNNKFVKVFKPIFLILKNKSGNLNVLVGLSGNLLARNTSIQFYLRWLMQKNIPIQQKKTVFYHSIRKRVKLINGKLYKSNHRNALFNFNKSVLHLRKFYFLLYGFNLIQNRAFFYQN